MSDPLSKIANIATPTVSRKSIVVDGPDVPILKMDPRFTQAFPEQAQNLKDFSAALFQWWRTTNIESPR